LLQVDSNCRNRRTVKSTKWITKDMLEEYIHELYVYDICNNSFISLCYRDSRHIIVGSIHILVMCLINPRKMDALHYRMSVSFQITLVIEIFYHTYCRNRDVLHYAYPDGWWFKLCCLLNDLLHTSQENSCFYVCSEYRVNWMHTYMHAPHYCICVCVCCFKLLWLLNDLPHLL
jgi:hypothetical protein